MTTERKEQIVRNLLDTYRIYSEVCMAEFLASEDVNQFVDCSFEDAFEIYMECMKIVEGDKFYTVKEGETIEL